VAAVAVRRCVATQSISRIIDDDDGRPQIFISWSSSTLLLRGVSRSECAVSLDFLSIITSRSQKCTEECSFLSAVVLVCSSTNSIVSFYMLSVHRQLQMANSKFHLCSSVNLAGRSRQYLRSLARPSAIIQHATAVILILSTLLSPDNTFIDLDGQQEDNVECRRRRSCC
jgi:hypothetical protein